MLLVAWSTWNLNNAFTGRTDSSHEHCFYLQGDFFNWASPENVSRLAPPPQICLDWASLNFLGVGIIFTSPDT